ncbi:MAG: hypothetical protein QOF84_2309 [Streptomyces sp.]|jgi:hypothetical protein|nr:hypothetical protein [Streptomyces sp.]
MRVETRPRVAAVPLDGDRLIGCGEAFAAQHADQPSVAVRILAGLFAAGAPRECQRGLKLRDAACQ